MGEKERDERGCCCCGLVAIEVEVALTFCVVDNVGKLLGMMVLLRKAQTEQTRAGRSRMGV